MYEKPRRRLRWKEVEAIAYPVIGKWLGKQGVPRELLAQTNVNSQPDSDYEIVKLMFYDPALEQTQDDFFGRAVLIVRVNAYTGELTIEHEENYPWV